MAEADPASLPQRERSRSPRGAAPTATATVPADAVAVGDAAPSGATTETVVADAATTASAAVAAVGTSAEAEAQAQVIAAGVSPAPLAAPAQPSPLDAAALQQATATASPGASGTVQAAVEAAAAQVAAAVAAAGAAGGAGIAATAVPGVLGGSIPQVAAGTAAAAVPSLSSLATLAGQPGAGANLLPGTTSTHHHIPSGKLGQLLGYKGLTIQKVKELAQVTRLHILEKERARFQPTIPIEIAGTPEQVVRCKNLLEAVCAGDQSELGHATTYVNIEPSVVGKVMGFKGSTVKQMTEVTGCYVEIQQDRSRGAADTPRLFVAGPPTQVESAVQLIDRFIAAPGSKLDVVLGQQPLGAAPMAAITDNSQASSLQAVLAQLGQTAGASGLMSSAVATSAAGTLTAFEPDGPKVEKIVEVPARKKGHLLGLHGQTIEKIRQTSGVIKCHIQADRSHNDKMGNIHVQVFGTAERVENCINIIQNVINGDHSQIGHASDLVAVDPAKVNRLRGDRWQVINTLKDLTGTYLDILQGVDAGVPMGEARLFIAGPPDCVERAKAIVTSLLLVMDQVPANGELNTQVVENVLGTLGGRGAASAVPSLAGSLAGSTATLQASFPTTPGLAPQFATLAAATQNPTNYLQTYGTHPSVGLTDQGLASLAPAATVFSPQVPAVPALDFGAQTTVAGLLGQAASASFGTQSVATTLGTQDLAAATAGLSFTQPGTSAFGSTVAALGAQPAAAPVFGTQVLASSPVTGTYDPYAAAAAPAAGLGAGIGFAGLS